MPRILCTHTILPEHSHTAEEAIVKYKEWVSTQSPIFQKKAEKIFHNAAIKEKHTIATAQVLFEERSFEQTNNLYKEKAIEYGTEILRQTLAKANMNPQDIDLLITTSCTGFMIPSVDAYVANNLGMRSDLRRMPITEIGCAAGAAALIYAYDFLKAYPDKKVAIITLEFPSNTIQLKDYSWDNIIGTAIFGDGVGCVILGEGDSRCPRIIDTQMLNFPNTLDILGYNLTNTGLNMNLDKTIPKVIEANFEKMAMPFMQKNGMQISDVDYFLAHPGGVKILDKIENVLAKYEKNVSTSRKIMETYGNMSSSTIIFILNEHMNKEHRDKTAYLLSFGPGFSAHQLLIKWE